VNGIPNPFFGTKVGELRAFRVAHLEIIALRDEPTKNGKQSDSRPLAARSHTAA
jgi:hypothetical protein